MEGAGAYRAFESRLNMGIELAFCTNFVCAFWANPLIAEPALAGGALFGNGVREMTA